MSIKKNLHTGKSNYCTFKLSSSNFGFDTQLEKSSHKNLNTQNFIYMEAED